MKRIHKHITKHVRNISKTTIKKGATTLILLFFAMAMLFQKDAPSGELQFVRDIDESFIHNAPGNEWDYLFQDEWWEDVYQGTLSTGSTSTNTNEPIIDNTNQIFEGIEDITGEIITWAMYTGTMYTGTMYSGTQVIATGNITWSLDCITPWNETIKNKDFTLAYQQRKDVNTICNVEKRVCLSGILLGSFEQRSCKEDVVYEYQKAEVISYNKKVLNEYIQPTDPMYSGAEFNTEGKIDTPENPTTTRGEGKWPVAWEDNEISTTTPTKAGCKTPRWQSISHGQFIKAYKAPRGFIDLPCDVQIRACVNGTLKWDFKYSKCTFNNTTYADYLTAWSPSSNTGFLFFQRIKKVFR